MKFLFATGDAHLPDQVGGAERSIHTLLTVLRENGHECEAVVGLRRGWRRKIVRRLALLTFGQRLHYSDWSNGYQTHRTVPWLAAKLTLQRLQDFVPDLVITQLDHSHGITELALSHGVRVALMVRTAEFHEYRWPQPRPGLKFISNSNFISTQLRQHLGFHSGVVYPIIQLADYRVKNAPAGAITFVNPTPKKGVETALALAALLPHRHFLFVESWRLEPSVKRELQNRLGSLPNVTLSPWTCDMTEVYARTAILIVPSLWQEAFGRVALEAHASGIPVIARDIGGLSEVLQESGILVAPDAPPQVWADEIERLFADRSLYAARSAAASANASRPVFDPQAQMERFVSLVSNWSE